MEKENCSADVTRQDGINGNEDEVICGLVLAGGEGKRLQPFIKSLGKGTLPKQYVNFIGSRSMFGAYRTARRKNDAP